MTAPTVLRLISFRPLHPHYKFNLNEFMYCLILADDKKKKKKKKKKSKKKKSKKHSEDSGSGSDSDGMKFLMVSHPIVCFSIVFLGV